MWAKLLDFQTETTGLNEEATNATDLLSLGIFRGTFHHTERILASAGLIDCRDGMSGCEQKRMQLYELLFSHICASVDPFDLIFINKSRQRKASDADAQQQ